jgi:hypothetical protein
VRRLVMDDQEQPAGSILEPIGRAAVDAVSGIGAEIGAIFGGADDEGPGAAIGRAAADIFDSPRDPWAPAEGTESAGESGGIIEALEREQANRPPVDETEPTGTIPDETPDGELPPDAEIFIER